MPSYSMKTSHVLTLLFSFLLFSSLGQSGWLPTIYSLPAQKMMSIVHGDQIYMLFDNGQFKVMDFTDASTSNLLAYPYSNLNTDFTYHFLRNNQIYVGFRSNSTSYFSMYDIDLGSWQILNPISSLSTNAIHQYFQTDNYFYVVERASNTIARYNEETNIWTEIEGPNVLNQKLGYSESGFGRIMTDDNNIWQLDESNNSWSLIHDWNGGAILTSPNSFQEKLVKDNRLYQLIDTGAYYDLVTYGFNTDDTYIVASSFTNCYEIWEYHDTIFSNFNGAVKKLINLCNTYVSVNITTEGMYYRRSEIPLTININYYPSTNQSNFTTSWYANGGNVQSNYIEFANQTTDSIVSIIFNTTDGYCNYSDTSTIQLASGYWAPITGLPMSGKDRTKAVAFGLDNYAYFGLGTSNALLKDFWRMDYSTKELTRLSDFPGEGRYGCTYTTMNDKGYIIGGTSSSQINEFWQFDPLSETWTQLQNFPASSIRGGVCFAINNTLYAGLGGTTNFYKYNLSNNTWSPAGNYPAANSTYGAICYLYNDSIFVGLGSNVYGGNAIHNLYKFDPSTEVWSIVSNSFLPQISGGEFWVHVFGNNIMVGGETDAFTKSYIYFPELNLTKDGPSARCGEGGFCEWERRAASYFSHGNRKYLAFGFNPNFVDQTNKSLISNSDDNGRYILEFNPDGCGDGRLVVPMHRISAINEYIPLQREVSISSNGASDRTIHTGGMVWTDLVDEFKLPEAGTYSALFIKHSAACADTFHFEVHVECKPSIDSIGPFLQGIKRFEPASWSVDGDFYVGLGSNDFAAEFHDFWKLDGSTQTWTQLANFPGVSRTQSSNFVIDHKLYIFGGIHDNSWDMGGTKLADLWEYDIDNNTWTQKSSHPAGDRSGSFACTYDGCAYIGCGLKGIGSAWTNQFYKYNPILDSWTQLANFPSTFGSHKACSVSIGDTIYIVGGYVKNVTCSACASLVAYYTYAYIVSTNTWFLQGPGPVGLMGFYGYGSAMAEGSGRRMAAGLFDNKIYLCGYDMVLSYDPLTLSWCYHGLISNYTSCEWYSTCEITSSGGFSNNSLYLFTDNGVQTPALLGVNRIHRVNMNQLQCGESINPMQTISSSDTYLCANDTAIISVLNPEMDSQLQWYLNGLPIEGAIEATFSTTISGNYQLRYNYNNFIFETNTISIAPGDTPNLFQIQDTTIALCNNPILFAIDSNLDYTLEWYLNDEIIQNETENNLTINQSGQYYALILGNDQICSIQSPVWTVNDANCDCLGDFNFDGVVAITDLEILLLQFGCLNSCSADLDGDEIITTNDIITFVGLFNLECD